MYEYFLYCKSKYPDVDKTKLITDETTSWCKSHLVPPSFVVFPNTVVNYQKITFTPFNDYTIMNENEFEKISEQAYKVLKNVSIIGDDLVNLIKENIKLESFEDKLNKPGQSAMTKEDLQRLIIRKEELYNSYVYNKTDDSTHIPIINKTFTHDDGFHGIFVVNNIGGPLHVGQDIFEEYDKMTTQDIINNMAQLGYTNIILIDYSCDICRQMFDIRPNKKYISNMIDQLKDKKLGRGLTNKSKNRSKNRKKNRSKNRKKNRKKNRSKRKNRKTISKNM